MPEGVYHIRGVGEAFGSGETCRREALGERWHLAARRGRIALVHLLLERFEVVVKIELFRPVQLHIALHLSAPRLPVAARPTRSHSARPARLARHRETHCDLRRTRDRENRYLCSTGKVDTLFVIDMDLRLASRQFRIGHLDRQYAVGEQSTFQISSSRHERT